jgi:excinuclease ABC subunit A
MASKKVNPKVTVEENFSTQDSIFVKGAKMHNLKNIDVHFPKNKFIVVTGVSGSGKSSLTMDTLFAEGQRRYAESLSSYARQFLMRMDKPNVDYISGICPAIAIEQKVTSRSPRSTVGSMTEIADYIRLLYARIGVTISPISGNIVRKDEVSHVVDFITKLTPSSKVLLLVPLQLHFGRSIQEELEVLIQKGFSRIYLVNENARQTIKIEEIIDSKLFEEIEINNAYLLIDRIVVKSFDDDDLHRIADSIQTAMYESEGGCWVEVDSEKMEVFNNKFEADGIVFEEPTPNFFSFNNPYGACPTCEGYGQVLGIDPNLVIPNKSLSVYDDAVACWKGDKMSEHKKEFIYNAARYNFPIHKPISQLSKQEYELLWNGAKGLQGIQHFFELVAQQLYKIQYRILQARYRGKTTCPTCNGSRLRKDALYVKVGNTSIDHLFQIPITDLSEWINQLELSSHDEQIATRILQELQQRVNTLLNVGLGYLTLDRTANTLSGGESQRIQLTRFLGSNLSDSMYILDEPSIGLHPRDTDRLISVLKNLRDLDNTVIVVEHDDMMMRTADHIIDMGPLASHLGGEVVAEGSLKEILNNPKSLTGQYLSGTLKIDVPQKRRKALGFLNLKGCRQHNLKNIDVQFPLGVLCVVSGVSGSGKTTLVKKVLYPALLRELEGAGDRPGEHDSFDGDLQLLQAVELIDQNPIGKSSRSNPVTYVKAWDEIRKLYAKQGLSKMRGYAEKHFSFNTEGGRCETCKGDGTIIVPMQFLADVTLVCSDCKGRKFKDDVLEVRVNGKNIFEVLELSVDEAIEHFKDEKKVAEAIQPLANVGLGYIKLGQSSDTISGGEAQRIKLASFLGKNASKNKVLFIFDEPTTGLHAHDIVKLLASLNALIEKGHSVIIIEHNTDVIKSADWVLDLGPEGGSGGGELLYVGYPEGLKKIKNSYTANYL